MDKFKIQGIGIDTTNLEFELLEDLDFGYIHTSISANNAHLLSNWTRYFSAPLVTSVDFLDNKSAIRHHLRILGRDRIDLLLVDSKCNFEKYSAELNDLLGEELVTEVGIKNPESVDVLESISKLMKFRMVSLELSPLNFNHEVVDWCRSHEVDIVEFNPFGGHLSAPSLIDSFGIQYLLNFAATYSKLVFLSGKDPVASIDNDNYLFSIIDKEADLTPYQVKKSVSKLIKPLKKAVNTSIVIDDCTIPSNLPEALFNLDEVKFSFGPAVFSSLVKVTENDNFISDVLSSFDLIKFPEDATSDADKMSVILPTIIDVAESHGLVTNIARIGTSAFIVSASLVTTKKKWITTETSIDTKFYILYYSNGNLLFRKINNSEETD